MKPCSIAVIGSGWRAECYLRILNNFKDKYRVCGVVSRTKEKREYISEKWGLPTFPSIEKLIHAKIPDFIIIAVSKTNCHSVITETAALNIPILAETPPANTIQDLIELNKSVPKDAKIEIAEQYFLYPINQARFSIMESGILGDINYSHISISHGYHGISLLRKTLGIGFNNCTIQASSTIFPTLEGPGRSGPPTKEAITDVDHTLAILKFGSKTGLYDFERNQHRSWARSSRFMIRGERGEIQNHELKYLKDYKTPINSSFRRINAGEDENLEGYYLKGIEVAGKWVYENPYSIGMSDDDLAMLTLLEKMRTYIATGESFYSLKEASQDQYIALLIEESAKNNKTVQTETQCWALGN